MIRCVPKTDDSQLYNMLTVFSVPLSHVTNNNNYYEHDRPNLYLSFSRHRLAANFRARRSLSPDLYSMPNPAPPFSLLPLILSGPCPHLHSVYLH